MTNTDVTEEEAAVIRLAKLEELATNLKIRNILLKMHGKQSCVQQDYGVLGLSEAVYIRKY